MRALQCYCLYSADFTGEVSCRCAFTEVTTVARTLELTPCPVLFLRARRHTHFSVDQIFSCHSRHFRRIDLPTPPKLKEELGKSYTMKDGSRPHVLDLSETADVKNWLEPVANHVQNFKDVGWFEFNLKTEGGERRCCTSVVRACFFFVHGLLR